MGGGAADDSQRRVVPRPEPILDHRCQEIASLPIPDELMVEILLRLPTPADLVRASTVCVSFRRVASDRSFVRRYRKLHAPPFLGFLDRHTFFRPVIAPHPSASAASAVAMAADFSFSFLPAPVSDWVVKDARDGRVLLDRPPEYQIDYSSYSVVFPDMVVCDPLHHQYLLLPPVPDNLAASVEDPLLLEWCRHCETFLVPTGNGDKETSATEETSFSVIWMAQCRTKLVAFVFSSRTGQWRAISSQSWSDLFAGLLSSTDLPLFSWHQYAYGCSYWVNDSMEKLLVLDSHSMEFSIAELPPEARGFPGDDIAIVEAGKGKLGMFVLLKDADLLNYSIRRNNCGSSSQWQFDKTISLESGYSYFFMGSTGRHLFIYQCCRASFDVRCFSLDVKTFQLERIFLSKSCHENACAYSSFPPSLLSTPTISSGAEKGGGEGDAGTRLCCKLKSPESE